MVKIVKLDFLNSSMSNIDNLLVMFFATWCGECKMMQKLILKIEKEYPQIKIYGVDVDAEKVWNDENKDFSIKKIPHFIFYKKSLEVNKLSGFVDERNFKKFLIKSLSD